MERDFPNGVIRDAIRFVRKIFPGSKEREFRLHSLLAEWEVFPSEIEQPSADYFKSLFTQFFKTGLQLGESTDDKTPEHACLKEQHKALREIFTILKGEKEPTVVARYSREKKDVSYEIYCGQPKPLTMADVVMLLEFYEKHYGDYLNGLLQATETEEKHGKKQEILYFPHEETCSVFRAFLMKIGQGLPADEIQTRLETILKKKL